MFEEFEKRAIESGYLFPVGIDEAGRGPLAGPVVAAACYLPISTEIAGVNDSKKLTHKQRREIVEKVLQNKEIHFSIQTVSHDEIDRINILEATLLAMKGAASGLDLPADYFFIDGNKAFDTSLPHETVIRGDSRVKSIALASILAKEHRDNLMRHYAKLYPEYGFDIHKGYATEMHLKMIQKYGPSPIHRMSFSPLKEMFGYKEIAIFTEVE